MSKPSASKSGHTLPCPVPPCDARRQPGKLMCLQHWRCVPQDIQGDVWRTWRALQHVANPANVDAYRAARDQAINAVTGEHSPRDEYDQSEHSFTTGRSQH